MNADRRFFLGFVLAMPGIAWAQSAPSTPFPSQPPLMPTHPHPPNDPFPPIPDSDPQQMVQRNWKEIKEEIERLFELASDLRKQVNTTASGDTLSMPLVKKIDEVEKLAKQLKKRARG